MTAAEDMLLRYITISANQWLLSLYLVGSACAHPMKIGGGYNFCNSKEFFVICVVYIYVDITSAS